VAGVPDTIMNNIRLVNSDADVVVLKFDSPGGEQWGIADAAKEIVAWPKPLGRRLAYTNPR